MKSAFGRQILLTTALIVLSFSILGSTFWLLMNRYVESEKRDTLYHNAIAISNLATAYEFAGQLEASWDFRISLSLASKITETDVVVCNPEGTVLICSCESINCDHRGKTVDEAFLSEVLTNGEAYRTGVLDTIYDGRRYIEGICLLSERTGDVIGVVIVSAQATQLARFLTTATNTFFYTAVAVLTLALLLTYLLSRTQTRPLRKLTEAVRTFGHGDMGVRVQIGGSNSREMDELATAFNNMADTLATSEKNRQEFIANISHELKTPMTTIAGFMDGMLDGTIAPEQHRQSMQTVVDEVRRLSRLVRSMLEVSHLQSEGVDDRHKNRFDMGDVIGRVLITFEQKINERKLAVDVRLPEKSVYVRAEQDSVTQVIYNLIDNAIKFCSDCGYLTIVLKTEGPKACVTVQNTGSVIPPEEIPLIFDRFHKADKSRSKDRSSMGLGLYIVKTIIGNHGEDIWVESHDGITAFTFTMPLTK